MVSAKALNLIAPSKAQPFTIEAKLTKKRHRYYWATAFRNFLMVPVFPMVGYCLLDQTGFTQWLISLGLIPSAILGEGFGHVGFCFSIHYLFTGIKAFSKALGLFQR